VKGERLRKEFTKVRTITLFNINNSKDKSIFKIWDLIIKNSNVLERNNKEINEVIEILCSEIRINNLVIIFSYRTYKAFSKENSSQKT